LVPSLCVLAEAVPETVGFCDPFAGDLIRCLKLSAVGGRGSGGFDASSRYLSPGNMPSQISRLHRGACQKKRQASFESWRNGVSVSHPTSTRKSLSMTKNPHA